MIDFLWKPQQGLIYRPWTKGDESVDVKIHIGQSIFKGTFMVKEDSCTIHVWGRGKQPKLLNVPRNLVRIRRTKNKTKYAVVSGIGYQGQGGLPPWNGKMKRGGWLRITTYEVFVESSDILLG